MCQVTARKWDEVAAGFHQIGLREPIRNSTLDADVFHRFAGIGTHASGPQNGQRHGSAGRKHSQGRLEIDDTFEPLDQLLVVQPAACAASAGIFVHADNVADFVILEARCKGIGSAVGSGIDD